MKDEKICILYLDDEVNNLTAFKANFRQKYEVFTAETSEAARSILEKNKIHVIVADQKMPNMTGVEFLGSIKKKYPDPIRMLLTGYSDIEAVIDAINIGKVHNYITKPWDKNEISILIDQAYEIYRLREEKDELIKKLLKANGQLEFMVRQKILS